MVPSLPGDLYPQGFIAFSQPHSVQGTIRISMYCRARGARGLGDTSKVTWLPVVGLGLGPGPLP